MHIRFSHLIGFPVTEEGSDHDLGSISGILIVPDTGKIEGFFVHTHGFLGAESLYVSALDIIRWGTRVYIRSQDCLAPAEDRIRLQDLLRDPRTILRQKIQTESGTLVGKCADVQFNTESMHIEWLFPKRWFRIGMALPVSDILEVRPEAVIVSDPIKKESISQEEASSPALPESEPAVARVSK